MTVEVPLRVPADDASETFDLDELLAQRQWIRRWRPFPHLVATDVFVSDFYAELEHDFERRLGRVADAGGFERNMPGYDALGSTFDRTLTGPFRVFFSRAWHDMIAELVGVDATGHVSGGLHHHHVGSASGTVHNDLNPGWFVDIETPEGLVIASPDLCSYGTGHTERDDVRPRELMRAVAVLFYVANPPWSPGAGGATGLYRHRDDDVGRPAAIVPPRSNSLLAFECTPHSFHSFLCNHRHARNSLVMWLHRPKETVVERWGEAPIVYWAS
jgi:2OG-Fe(II) oxygenase superfamily